MKEVWNAYYFQIGLQLRKTRDFNLKSVNIVRVLDVLFNDLQIWLQRNLISNSCNSQRVRSNEVHKNFRLHISKCPVDVSNMYRRIFHKLHIIVITHRDSNMFSWWTFHSHLNVWLQFWDAFDNIVDLIYLFCANRWKYFLNLNDFGCADILLWGLSIWLWRLPGSISQFVALEEFRDYIDLLLRFGRNR